MYVAGFNAHGQLSPEHRRDVTTFTIHHEPGRSRILYAGWSSVVMITNNEVISYGHEMFRYHLDLEDPSGAETLHSAFGDENGMLGCLDSAGRLFRVGRQASECADTDDERRISIRLTMVSGESSPRLNGVAAAGSGRYAAILLSDQETGTSQIVEAENAQAFYEWYETGGSNNHFHVKVHLLRGQAKQLRATAVNFVVLMQNGEVYTWGDPRHQTLGRPFSLVAGAHSPSTVDLLQGADIIRVVCGNWLSGALSRDGALYLWGGQQPGSQECIQCIQPSEMNLADITSGRDNELVDIRGVGIGDHHVVVVTSEGTVFVIGDNRNGQLGSSEKTKFVHDWDRVILAHEVSDIVCGPKSTILLLSPTG